MGDNTTIFDTISPGKPKPDNHLYRYDISTIKPQKNQSK